MKKSKTTSKINAGWEHLNKVYSILNGISASPDGLFHITSDDINANVDVDARLMTKFDSLKNLPLFFKENSLCILPVTNGEYVIGHFNAYMNFPKINCMPEKIKFPADMQTITAESISSESDAIAIAEETEILSNFLNGNSKRKSEYRQSKSSKMRTDNFSFWIDSFNSGKKMKIEVNHAQIEVDAAYESKDELVLIEAKNCVHDDFIVRQLFFPYRKFSETMPKTIRLIFLVYNEKTRVFTFYEYHVDDPDYYNSLRFVKAKSYVFETEMDILDVSNACKLYKNKPILNDPFPHAVSFDKVDTVFRAFINKKKGKDEDRVLKLSKSSLAKTCALSFSSIDICLETLMYFGFLEEDATNGEYFPSIRGKSVINMGNRERFINYIFYMRLNNPFKNALNASLKKGCPIDKDEILSLVKKRFRKSLNPALTADEKVKTINTWLSWIFGNMKKC